jgi:hypothetical protein
MHSNTHPRPAHRKYSIPLFHPKHTQHVDYIRHPPHLERILSTTRNNNPFSPGRFHELTCVCDELLSGCGEEEGGVREFECDAVLGREVHWSGFDVECEAGGEWE